MVRWSLHLPIHPCQRPQRRDRSPRGHRYHHRHLVVESTGAKERLPGLVSVFVHSVKDPSPWYPYSAKHSCRIRITSDPVANMGENPSDCGSLGGLTAEPSRRSVARSRTQLVAEDSNDHNSRLVQSVDGLVQGVDGLTQYADNMTQGADSTVASARSSSHW
jgi:hypothetical protein